MQACKDSIRERLQQAKELRQTTNDVEQAFRTSMVDMSNSLVLLVHQAKEIANVLKDLNNRVLTLEKNLQQTRE